jgi:hypothetical protein
MAKDSNIPVTWFVGRFSLMTDALLKTVGGPFRSREEAVTWLEGFGQDAQNRRLTRVSDAELDAAEDLIMAAPLSAPALVRMCAALMVATCIRSTVPL